MSSPTKGAEVAMEFHRRFNDSTHVPIRIKGHVTDVNEEDGTATMKSVVGRTVETTVRVFLTQRTCLIRTCESTHSFFVCLRLH